MNIYVIELSLEFSFQFSLSALLFLIKENQIIHWKVCAAYVQNWHEYWSLTNFATQ